MCVPLASLFSPNNPRFSRYYHTLKPGKTGGYPPAIHTEYIGGIPMHLAVSMRGGTPLVIKLLW